MAINVNVLKRVWGKQEGHVCLTSLDTNEKDRKKNWREKFFKYPEEFDLIPKWIRMQEGKNLYWSPHVYHTPRRVKENILEECNFLWSDLDFASPDTLKVPANIVWKSSDDRYQCLWVMDEAIPKEEAEALSRSIAYLSGADKSGWDLTQVLRIPGATNYKYDPPQEGQLLKYEYKTPVRLDELTAWARTYKEPTPETKTLDPIDLTVGEGRELLLERMDQWHIKGKLREMLLQTDVDGEDRSDRLWAMEHRMIEMGVPVQTVVEIVKLSEWNKYRGRRDEDVRLLTEVMAVEQEVRELKKTPPKVVEESWLQSYEEFTSHYIEPPAWLVRDIWHQGSYGVIAGEPKTFKSMQAVDLSLSVASGTPYLGMFPVEKQGPVLYIQEENSAALMQDRILKIAHHKGLTIPTSHGAVIPMPLPLYVSNNVGFDLTEDTCRASLKEAIERLKPVLVVLDPMYMMMGTTDENSATEVGKLLQFLTQLRNEYGCAIMVLHHYRKGKPDERGGQRMRGSSVFHAWIECAMYVQAQPEKGHVIVEREFRAAGGLPDINLRIAMGEAGEMYYHPTVDTSYVSEMLEGALITAITGALRTGSSTVEELSTRLKCKKKTLRQLLALLIEQGDVVKEGSDYRLSGGESCEAEV